LPRPLEIRYYDTSSRSRGGGRKGGKYCETGLLYTRRGGKRVDREARFINTMITERGRERNKINYVKRRGANPFSPEQGQGGKEG